MLEGLVVTVLTCLIVVWVGFSMAGRDEARVSASVDLNKWYSYKSIANIVGMEEIELERDYVSLFGRGVQNQKGTRLTLEYTNSSKHSLRSTHMFYDDSKQDEVFLEKYIKDNQLVVWIAKDGSVYVPGEIIDNQKIQTIHGADKVLVYSMATAIVASVVSMLFLLFLSPFWILVHLPIVWASSLIPQGLMYIQEIGSEVQRKNYQSVSALTQFGLYVDESEEGIRQLKLVEQTLPMVLLEEGVGYLGYTPGKVAVLVDYDGNIPVHIASEYHIPEVIATVINKVRGK